MDNAGITITSGETLETIEINGNALQGDLNKEIYFIATLGTAHCTDVEIEFIDSSCPEITLNSKDGRICLSDVCTHPEDRLFKETNLTGLSQSFPNPAQNTIEINYSLAGDCFAEMEFFNSLGESVLKPVSEFHKFGSYKLMLDTKQLPNGMYFYILKANGDTYSRTLVVDNK